MVDFAPGKLCQEIIFQYVKKMNEIPEEHHNFFIENPKILLYAGEILMIMGITIFLIISW
jgi:hypothetical protein